MWNEVLKGKIMEDMIVNGCHSYSPEESYVEPKDPIIKERLEWFRDQKLALMMHFGPYSQIGLTPSWPLSEAADWAREGLDWEDDLDTFRKQYFDLNKSFNPVRFQPEKWAELAAEIGFKYLIFTTKHHDGFCMYDTKYSDYKITSSDCPFSNHKYSDIVRAVFDAFREKGIAIAAYFSKPDWHCPWFWVAGMDIPVGFNHRPTYDPKKYPELWEKFTEFTHNQIMELVENYGKIDILWLDGGQVNPAKGLDIRLNEVVAKARRVQPWLITADRTVGGENENYITPEQCIPDKAIRVPWESNLTIGKDWSYTYSDAYKSSRALVRMLIEVVSRGGNLAINVGPQPDGELPAEALKELKGLGDWLKVNGEAIFGTRVCEITQSENIMFTQKDGTLYAIIPLAEGELIENVIFIPTGKEVTEVVCLGSGVPLKFKKTPNGVSVTLPGELVGSNPYAIVFSLK